LFGSYARGDADENSDVDVLVEVDYNALVGLDYFGWNLDLEDLLHKHIDIVSAGYENKLIKPFIDKDKFVIYER
jgi:predicted nucleotidyltransferase